MFCQNCGTKNSDEAIFCEACGTKLDKGPAWQPAQEPVDPNPSPAPAQRQAQRNPAPPRQAARRQKKPVPVLLIVWIVEAALLAAVLSGAYVIADNGTGPEKTALNYFINIANGDWEKAYEKLDAEETDFINAQMFAIANQYNYLGNINNYEVVRQPEGLAFGEGSSLGMTVTINFRIKGDTQDQYFMVDLNRQPQNKYLLFDNWKVGTSNLVSRDYSVSVPEGASVTLDGVVLDDRYLQAAGEDSYGQVNYIIPQIFQGIHTITVSMEGREEVTDTVQIVYDNDSYYVDTMKYQPEVLSELIHTAGADMQKIYQAALDGKTLKTIEPLFTTEEEAAQEIQDAYGRLLSWMNEGSSRPTQISFSNITGRSDPYYGEVELSFDYTVDYTYEARRGGRKQDTYQGSDTWYFRFTQENGAWVLQNLGCEELYY